jgi:hypothetical protein
MAGKKGHGRPTKMEQDMRKLVLDKCWAQLFFSMCDKKVPNREKNSIAVSLASKNIPQQIDANMNMKVVQMGRVLIDGKPLELKVGNAIKPRSA